MSDQPDRSYDNTSSPDGAHIWLVSPAEWAATQWVLAGGLWRESTRSIVFDPPDDWSFDARTWLSNSILRLEARRYPGVMPGITMVLDIGDQSGTIEIDPNDTRASRNRVPAPPSGRQAFGMLLDWLRAYPKR